MSRQDMARVTVHVEKRVSGTWTPWPGLGDLGIWENRTGGGGDSEETKHREGGMGEYISLGGPTTIDNVTIARRYDHIRDAPIYATLMGARGKARVTVVEQDLDEFGVADGAVHSWSGKLKSVNKGDSNANSTDVRMLTCELSTDSFA